MNVVDSSGWLEYFAAGPNADFFAAAIEATDELVVPTVSIYEVFKRVLQQRGEGDALQAVALMQQGVVVELTRAARPGGGPHQRRRGAADGRQHHARDGAQLQATLWTQDADFASIDGVRTLRRTRG